MNPSKLLGIMRERGDTQETLSKAIGISRAALNRKIHSRAGSSFTQPEIAKIRGRYSLSAEEVDGIFFSS